MRYSEAALQKVREDRLLIDQVDLWLYELIEPFIGQRVLEIGCGMGNFARYLSDRELYIGTDISSESVACVNNLYADADNLIALKLDVVDPSFRELARYQVDTIFSLNVFEHIENDKGALKNAVSVLQPGGNLVLVVPAHDWLYGNIDRAIGHYRRYSKQKMSVCFQDIRLELVQQKYINLLGALGWLINGRVRKQETPPTGQLRLFNKLVPVLKRFESVVSVPFGISLLVVGRKKQDRSQP